MSANRRPPSANSRPPSIQDVMKYALKKGVTQETLGSQCTEAHFLQLADKITGWMEVAPHMHPAVVVEEIKNDSCSEKDKKLNMLRKWSQHLAFNATYMALIGVFLKAQRADLAQCVCDILGDSKGESASDSSVPAQVATSQHSVTEASRKVEFVLTSPLHSPTNELKQMPPDSHQTNTTDSSETYPLLKGNVRPAVDSLGVTSAEQTRSNIHSAMVITPPTKYWPDEVKDKLAAVCDPGAGVPEHYRTELVKLRRRVERLEQERAHKEDEHSADIKRYKIKCENMMQRKNLLERQLSESEKNEDHLEKKLCESKQKEKRLEKKLNESEKNETSLRENNETLIKQLASAKEKIYKYERRIQEISNERDRALQQYDDAFRKENDLFLKTVSESLDNLHDPRREADLKWLQTKAALTIDKSKSCPSFRTLTVTRL